MAEREESHETSVRTSYSDKTVRRVCKIYWVEFFNWLEIVNREEYEYKRVRARKLKNLCSCALISRLEEVLIDCSRPAA